MVGVRQLGGIGCVCEMQQASMASASVSLCSLDVTVFLLINITDQCRITTVTTNEVADSAEHTWVHVSVPFKLHHTV